LSKWSDFPYTKQQVCDLSTCELTLAPGMGVVSLTTIGGSIATLNVSLAVLGLMLPVAAQDRLNEDAVTVTLNQVDESGVRVVEMPSGKGSGADVAIRVTGTFERLANHVHKIFCHNANPDPLLPLTLARTESVSRDPELSLG
jgi:precorrin-6B methylase 2